MGLSDNQLEGTIKHNNELGPIFYPLINTDGKYQLDLSSLEMDGKGKYLGNVFLNLSSGRSYQLYAKGKINLKKNIISLKLKGIKGQSSAGISLSVLINMENVITSIKGKVFGQKVLFIKNP